MSIRALRAIKTTSRRLVLVIAVGVVCVISACAPLAAQPQGGTSTGPHMPLGLAVAEGSQPILFAALKEGGVKVFDRSVSPVREIAAIPRSALGGLDAMNLHLDGKHLFVALSDHFRAGGAHAGLAVIDVATPKAPKVLGRWRSSARLEGAGDIFVHKGIAWLGMMSEGIVAIDVSNPSDPKAIATYRPDPNFPKRNPGRLQIPAARGLYAQHDRLYIAYDAGGLRILDITRPARPREIGRFINPAMKGKPAAHNNVLVRGKLAYIAVDYCGLEIVDIRRPERPRLVGWWNPWGCERSSNLWFGSPGHTNQLAWAGPDQLAFSAGDSELQIVDVSDPARPKLSDGTGAPKNGLGVWSLAHNGTQIYLGYIRTIVPFRGTWSGIRSIRVE